MLPQAKCTPCGLPRKSYYSHDTAYSIACHLFLRTGLPLLEAQIFDAFVVVETTAQ
jgi:hypothetical protein